MELYSAVLTTAPFILLALSGGLVFGPLPVRGRRRAWRLQRGALLTDVVAVVSVMIGAIVSLLVLGEQIRVTDTWRDVVLWSGCLSLFMLMMHVIFDVLARYAEGQAGDSSARPVGQDDA